MFKIFIQFPSYVSDLNAVSSFSDKRLAIQLIEVLEKSANHSTEMNASVMTLCR